MLIKQIADWIWWSNNYLRIMSEN